MKLTPQVSNEIMGAAKASPDTEICGYIDVGGAFVQTENKSVDPSEQFDTDIPINDAQAIIHSHPGGSFYPSAVDMRQQDACAIPWGIAAFDDEQSELFWLGDSPAPLVGRGFRHGVTDCYSIVRDFYKIAHSINLPDFPRDWEWWERDDKLYETGFSQAGFSEIATNDILPGDVFLATIRADTINHAGVYLGNGLILHHTCGRDGYDPTRLSSVEPGARWFNFITKVVRHENDTIDRKAGQGIWP